MTECPNETVHTVRMSRLFPMFRIPIHLSILSDYSHRSGSRFCRTLYGSKPRFEKNISRWTLFFSFDRHGPVVLRPCTNSLDQARLFVRPDMVSKCLIILLSAVSPAGLDPNQARRFVGFSVTVVRIRSNTYS